MKTPTREQSNVISRFVDAETKMLEEEQKMHDIRAEFKTKFGEELDDFYS